MDDLKLADHVRHPGGHGAGGPVAGAPVIRSEGRGFPIDYHYRPASCQQCQPQVGAVVLEALCGPRRHALWCSCRDVERLAQCGWRGVSARQDLITHFGRHPAEQITAIHLGANPPSGPTARASARTGQIPPGARRLHPVRGHHRAAQNIDRLLSAYEVFL